MPNITQIIETSLYVRDIDEAEAFYSDLLGVPAYSKDNQRHVFFKIGDGMLLLFYASETRKGGSLPSHGMSGEGHVAFAMHHHEVDAWKQRLREKQIDIELEYDWPTGGKSLYFRDPSGNSLELVTPDTWP